MKNIIILSYSACESITKEASFYTGLLLQFTKYREKIQLQLLIQWRTTSEALWSIHEWRQWSFSVM